LLLGEDRNSIYISRWLANLMDSNMRWLRDMLGLGNKSQLILVGIENGGKDF